MSDKPRRGIEQVIDRMLEITGSDEPFVNDKEVWERSFALLLNTFRVQLPEMSDRFHKTFRQTDVIEIEGVDTSDIDMAIWHALHVSEAFWQAYAEIEEAMMVVEDG